MELGGDSTRSSWSSQARMSVLGLKEKRKKRLEADSRGGSQAQPDCDLAGTARSLGGFFGQASRHCFLPNQRNLNVFKPEFEKSFAQARGQAFLQLLENVAFEERRF